MSQKGVLSGLPCLQVPAAVCEVLRTACYIEFVLVKLLLVFHGLY